MNFSRFSRSLAGLFCLCIINPAMYVNASEVIPEVESLQEMRELAEKLTGRDFAGRGSGTPEVEAAADYLATVMESAGLEPAFSGSWFQTFPLSGEGWAGEDLSGKTGQNVAGILPGSGNLRDRFLIIGAHYDHLGRVELAEPGSPAPDPGEYYAGANDNASGVAVLFQLVRMAKNSDLVDQEQQGRRSIVFVNFGGEEIGLKGSGYLVSHPPVPLDMVDLMINLDTVGQMSENRLYVSGVGTANILPELVGKANNGDLKLSLAQGGWSGSDHMSFNTREVPVLFIFGGPYQEYNTPRDVCSTLNFEGMGLISEFLSRLIDDSRTQDGDFNWIMVAEAENDQGDNVGQNKNTWFGSMPDFTEDVEGYKLAGVFDGSPAAKGGLIKGDVLVKLAGQKVVDLPSFTRILRGHSPGHLVEVTVHREGKSLNFTIVLGDRSERK